MTEQMGFDTRLGRRTLKFNESKVKRDSLGRFSNGSGIRLRRKIAACPHPDFYKIVEQHAHSLGCSMGNALLDLAMRGYEKSDPLVATKQNAAKAAARLAESIKEDEAQK